MASLNRVLVMGNIGRDPELRRTSSGRQVTTLNVATSESYKNKDGILEEVTEWHRIVVWGKQAEVCTTYLRKGRTVVVDGRLQTRSWTDKLGAKHYTTEIIANGVRFIGAPVGEAATRKGEDLAYASGPAGTKPAVRLAGAEIPF